jgi:hypothetical protein
MPKPMFPAAGEAMPKANPQTRRFFLVVGKAGAAAAATATLMNGLGASAALSLPARGGWSPRVTQRSSRGVSEGRTRGGLR